MDRMSVLIWVQTVCKGYLQMTKVAASQERVNAHLFNESYQILTTLTHMVLSIFKSLYVHVLLSSISRHLCLSSNSTDKVCPQLRP